MITPAAAQAALTKTLLGTCTVQAATFNARVAARIQAQQDTAKQTPKVGA